MFWWWRRGGTDRGQSNVMWQENENSIYAYNSRPFSNFFLKKKNKVSHIHLWNKMHFF